MKYRFINQNNSLYQQAVDLRISAFFKGMINAKELINDTFENRSLQLVCVVNDKVIGTGRLTIENEDLIVSQMAIDIKFQGQGVGKEILNILIDKSKEFNASKIILSARETAIEFYEKYGFVPNGKLFPSVKTGVIHQKMNRVL